MNKVRLVSVSMLSVLALLGVLVSNAKATTVGPSLALTVFTSSSDSVTTEIPLDVMNEGDGTIYSAESIFDGGTLSFKSSTDPDALLIFAVGFTNNSNSVQTYHFTTAPIPITIPVNPTTVSSSLSYSYTDGQANGIHVKPVAPGSYIQKSSIITSGGSTISLGIDIDNVGFDATGFSTTKSYAGPAINVGPIAGPYSDGTWASLIVDIDLTLSPHDSVSLNGSTEINAVPIPPAGVLLLFGLVGMVGIKKKFNLSN
ncbi:MAG: hypothetical protein AB1847_12690 [bacterium]